MLDFSGNHLDDELASRKHLFFERLFYINVTLEGMFPERKVFSIFTVMKEYCYRQTFDRFQHPYRDT